MPLIPARKGVAFMVKAGQEVKITNTYGKQVLDFFAFHRNNAREYLSMVHTRTVNGKLVLNKGDKLYNTRRQPVLTLTEDTTPGTHDMIFAACDAERYRQMGYEGYHENCSDNLHQALRDTFPDFHIDDDWVPDPLNLFMNVPINHYGGLDLKPPTSEKGQYVVLRAEVDLVIAISACPQDLNLVNGGTPMDCEYEILGSSEEQVSSPQLTMSPTVAHRRRVKVAFTIDFDALSHWLGTGSHQDNNMMDFSSGIFSAQVGVYRILDLLKKHVISDKVTWFIPGHTTETFPEAAKAVADSGAEIGLHGYAHEGIYQMTEEQESDVLRKSIEVATRLTGRRPLGYRAPMYTIRETTVALLREHQFLYDSSLMHHDSQPYFTPSDPPVAMVDYSQPASSWLHPSPIVSSTMYPAPGVHPLVEIPTGWYSEDMMPMQYLPHLPNSAGYVSTRVIEQMWKDKFMWLWENGKEEEWVFPLLIHPDTSGMAHVIGMIDRMLGWLKGFGEAVQFCTCESIARDWLEKQELAVHKGRE